MPLNNPSISQVTKSSTVTPSTVASTVTSSVLLAANVARVGASIWNKSNNDLFVELGNTASINAYTVKISADGYYEVPFGYTGVIAGVWDAVDGNALIREFV